MAIDDLLNTRRTEHNALLQRAVEVLETDPRVVAAWLFGSHGRRTADAFSDIDLWVVVADKQIETVCAERQDYVARIGKPLLLLEAPNNAPAGGAYLMALYPGLAGLHQIDWYWQRQSAASRPRNAELLFDVGNIPADIRREQLDPSGKSVSLTLSEVAARVTQRNDFFWVMSNIAVKSILRRQAWTAVSMLEMLRGLVDEVRGLLDLNSVRKGQEEWRTSTLPPVLPRDQLALLRETAQAMEQLLHRIEAIRGHVQVAAIPYVYDFFDLADTLIQQNENGLYTRTL